jgi:hypothetical protein
MQFFFLLLRLILLQCYAASWFRHADEWRLV